MKCDSFLGNVAALGGEEEEEECGQFLPGDSSSGGGRVVAQRNIEDEEFLYDPNKLSDGRRRRHR